MSRFAGTGRARWAAALAGAALALACAPSSDDTVIRDVPRDARDGTDDTATPDGSVRCGHDREPCCSGSGCGPGLTCVAGTCTAAAACGREGQPCCSGMACADELVCTGGTCVAEPACGGERQPCCAGGACRSGLVCDRDTCVPTAACGSLRQPCCSGTACASGLVCTAGVCETAPACGGAREPCCGGTACNAGLVCTGGTCQTAPAACGALGQPCCSGSTCTASGATCCGGACVDTTRDPRNCGSCGARCDGTCSGGSCSSASCGAEGQPCCTSGDRCRAGLECNAASQCVRSSSACSPVRAACAAASECCSSLSCRGAPDDAQCCVEAGGSCASSLDCCGWMSCVSGHCACQVGSDLCAATADCCSGLTCTDESCTTGSTTDPCAEARSCADCTGRASCGWCGATATCMTGALAGPTAGSCASGWSWYVSSCGATTDPCAANTDCASCNSVATCGWCRATGTCATGGSAGPTSGSCADWVWYVSGCSGSTTDPCDSHGSCGTCTVVAGCGWCNDTSSCRTGTSSGPSSGSCGDWDWLSLQCAADECAGTYDCEACTGTAACGWCNSTSTCMSGSWGGPASGSCADWVWYASACASADPCDDSWSCEDCTGRAACGWCAASWTCMTGGPAGPDAGACSDWRYRSSDCVTTDPCNGHGDCATCTADSACGWCEATWTCMTGGSSGPTSGYCSDWRYYGSSCPAPPDPCDVHSDCAACTAASGCGWCEATWSCLTGTSSGPTGSYCSDWNYYPADCVPSDPCNDHWSCTTCTGDSACGWCESSYTCMTGDYYGPDVGSCSDWRYYDTECP